MQFQGQLLTKQAIFDSSIVAKNWFTSYDKKEKDAHPILEAIVLLEWKDTTYLVSGYHTLSHADNFVELPVYFAYASSLNNAIDTLHQQLGSLYYTKDKDAIQNELGLLSEEQKALHTLAKILETSHELTEINERNKQLKIKMVHEIKVKNLAGLYGSTQVKELFEEYQIPMEKGFRLLLPYTKFVADYYETHIYKSPTVVSVPAIRYYWLLLTGIFETLERQQKAYNLEHVREILEPCVQKWASNPDQFVQAFDNIHSTKVLANEHKEALRKLLPKTFKILPE